MATQASVLAWRIPGMGEPGGLLSIGSHRVRHNWSDLTAAAAEVSYLTIWTVSSIETDSKLFLPLWFFCASDSVIFFFFFLFLNFGKLHSTWARFGNTPNWKCSSLLVVKKTCLFVNTPFITATNIWGNKFGKGALKIKINQVLSLFFTFQIWYSSLFGNENMNPIFQANLRLKFW